jgi:oxygen-independent coproporphyrinogen-3 oxidase
MVDAICNEIKLRQTEIGKSISTIYFGGGTPSLLSKDQLDQILKQIQNLFDIEENAEITLEANPDDLNEEKLTGFKQGGINRLSIGVQSFFDRDLKWMNRAHNAEEAQYSLEIAQKYFDNISLDLIYGVPGMSEKRWIENLDRAIALKIPHLSCYALTVEPKTVLANKISQGKTEPVEDKLCRAHYDILTEKMKAAGFVNYEFSSFGKTGFFSQNNLGYWFGKPYLGIGPGAHSFTENQRSWNIAHNIHYMKGIENAERDFKTETLSITDQFNEYIMTRLRTQWGISMVEIESDFGSKFADHVLKESAGFLQKDLLTREENHLVITPKGKFLTDGIAAELFWVE